MLKLLFKLVLIIMLGTLVYDINQTGCFEKTQIFKYLKSSGSLEYLKHFLVGMKKISTKHFQWVESDFQQYYNDACIYMKPYINLSYDLALIFKNSTVAITNNLMNYLEKNFPQFQNQVSILLSDSVKIAKEGVVIISNYISSLVTNAGKYTNEMFKS